MARNDRLVMPYYRPDLVKIAVICELTSLFFIFVAVIFYIGVLTRKEVTQPEKPMLKSQFCHKNLLVLLLAHPITHLTFLLLRLVRHALFALDLLNDEIVYYLNFVSDMFVSTTFFILLAYSIERTVSIKYITTYEKMCAKRPYLGVFLLASSILFSFVLILGWNLRFFSTLVAYGMQYCQFTVATYFFICLRIKSGRIYNEVALKKESTVNERFWTARNLNAAKLLLRLAPFKCVSNYFSLAIYFWCFELHSPYFLPLYSCVYFLSSHVQLYVQMTLTVCGHSILREELRALLGCGQREKPEEVRNVLGRRMIFSVQQQNEVYFSQMRSVWETAAAADCAEKSSKYLARRETPR